MVTAEESLLSEFGHIEEAGNDISPIECSEPELLDKLEVAIEEKHFNSRTEQNYRHWINRFIVYNDLKNPATLGQRQVKDFLNYLVTRVHVSKAKLNQAKLAIDFFYEEVLKKPLRPAGIC